MRKRRYEILLPLTYNDGRPVSPELFENHQFFTTLKAVLIDRFEQIEIYSRPFPSTSCNATATPEDLAMKRILRLGLTAAFLLLLCNSMPAGPADRPLPKDLAPYFRPPKELEGDLGYYKSPLRFDGGAAVKTPEQWKKRRGEILKSWHDALGEWPPLIAKPKIEYLEKQRRDNITQWRVRIEIAPGRMTDDAYLMIPDGDGPFPAAVVVFYEAKSGIGKGKAALLDYAHQLARRGFVTLSVGSPPASYFPDKDKAQLQPLSFHAYVAANCFNILANLPYVDAARIGIVGHSYGGKWALFASCLFDRFACAAWSDPGIVFDERRGNVNYWEPWYIGHERGKARKAGIPKEDNPRTGPYKTLFENGRDLHELHVLMAPRPFLVSGGSEDPPERWKALNHSVAVNKLLGFENRVGMTNRKGHAPTEEHNEVLYRFFEHFLKDGAAKGKEP
jgi:hypothetical protein